MTPLSSPAASSSGPDNAVGAAMGRPRKPSDGTPAAGEDAARFAALTGPAAEVDAASVEAEAANAGGISRTGLSAAHAERSADELALSPRTQAPGREPTGLPRDVVPVRTVAPRASAASPVARPLTSAIPSAEGQAAHGAPARPAEGAVAPVSPRAPAATASPAHRSTLGAPPSAVAPKATAAAAPLADPVGLPSATTPADASAPLLTTPTVREPGAPAPSSPASSSSALEGPAQQVVRAVAHAPGERVVEVRLDPPSLGRVRIEFDFSGDTVRAVVSAAEPETLSLLRRGGAGLARDLAELGYGEAEIEYAEDRSDRPDAWDDGPHAFALPAANAPALAATAAPLAVRLHDGALDITL